MDRISTAYQLAKSVYKRPFLFYDDEIMQHQTHVKEIEMMFPSAIENEEFKVFYQPKTQLNNYQALKHYADGSETERLFRLASLSLFLKAARRYARWISTCWIMSAAISDAGSTRAARL